MATNINRQSSKLFTLIIVYIMTQIQISSAMFNCLKPNMLSVGKPTSFMGFDGFLDQQRAMVNPIANWQSMLYPVPNGNQFPINQNPMRRLLFQPRWKSGMLAQKLGLGAWPMYRPNYGPWPSQMPGIPSQSLPGYPIDGELKIAPFSLPQNLPYKPVENNDYPWSKITNNPFTAKFQQSQINLYDSTLPSTSTPNQVDSYSLSTKTLPITTPVKGQTITTSTSTSKNFLMTKAGYNILNGNLLTGTKVITADRNSTSHFGYAYPDWYTVSNNDSPGRIAQQLFRLNTLRSQRLQNDPTSSASIGPKFEGFGSVEPLIDQGELRLKCLFEVPIDPANRPIWIKFIGGTPEVDLTNMSASFDCAGLNCRTLELDPSQNSRLDMLNGLHTSTLVIKNPTSSDEGVYRCSALSRDVLSPRTSFQIIRLKNIM